MPQFYPFSAICGTDQAKKALMCMMVNPRIKGVLITGASGVAKTTLARSLSNSAFGRSLTNVPLSVTEEQLFGCLDIESAIRDGSMIIQEGLLHRSCGGYLYADDLNLFDQKMVISMMNAVLGGKVIVERENLSAEYDCDTAVIATMNTSDGYVNPRILDYFDMCVRIVCPENASEREEILDRNLSFSADPHAFADRYADLDSDVLRLIDAARGLLPSVEVSDDVVSAVAEITSSMNIEGYRGDISTVNVCMAIAALNGRTCITEQDIKEAAVLCLSHRRGRAVPKKEKKKVKEENSSFGNSHMKRFIHDDRAAPVEEAPVETETTDRVPSETPADLPEIESVVFDVGEIFESVDIINGGFERMMGVKGSGKRMFAVSDDRSGNYVRSRITDKKNPDLAFDATIRAAAPYQVGRHSDPEKDDSIIIMKQDIREKIRERRSSCTFLFLVDTSGSLIIRSRMIGVKGAIMSLLNDHYMRRDRVGFMTFNEKAIEMLLPPTRSVECVQKLLDKLPVGEMTPLGDAMIRADEFMKSYVRKHPYERCYIILITDGKANIPINEGADPVEESLRLAHTIDTPNTEWIIVDTNTKREIRDYSKDLADAMSANYITLDDLKMNI